MKQCFLTICLLICMKISIQAAPTTREEALNWQCEHYDGLRDSVQTCIEKTWLPFFTPGEDKKLVLGNDPMEMRMEDENHITTIMPGVIIQNDVKVTALFYVEQQIEPYIATATLMCTSSDNYMPNVKLFYNILCHPIMRSKYLPNNDFQIHLEGKGIDEKGNYFQDWILYNSTMRNVVGICLYFGQDGMEFRFI